MDEPVQILDWQATKVDSDKGRWLLDSHDFKLPKEFTVAQSAVIGLAPGGWAANHRHAKREIFLALAGELYLVWRTADGQRHEQPMVAEHGQLQAFVTGPNVDHLVENRGNSDASLYEWSDGTDAAMMLEGNDSLR